ncbi:hypothetical protein BGX31_002631 [Mortierella sp. GBA43]|nr:hypothetical protein BGX31_002631 [Mortierella sp. GBA43]
MDFKQTGPQAASNLIGWGLTSRDIVEVGTRLGRDPIIPEIVEPSVRLGTNKTNFYGALRWTTKDKDVKGQGTVFVTKELMVI